MKILMLQTRYGSEDGFVVRRFTQNQEYEVADSLGVYFVRIGAAQSKINIQNIPASAGTEGENKC